ncbi:FAD-dependent oxidoreductase [Vallitalea okinawensis]|uniref:FAD-dependent oxidoreductase n=1 Tax=Vallitalea okinawensis TaxID=2078660 RepID=UPI000CFCD7ED|nr:FAD-dependent oxidoreductase [Vallitalea okinawensis]
MLHVTKNYDVVVVGGGMSGVCAAIASARHGAKTALVQNRPVLGGNASSEIRMHICGADMHSKRKNARETGIIEEILLENKKRNPNHSFSIFDTILWEKTNFQENLDLYLNTHMTEVFKENNKIHSVTATQLTTEKTFEFNAPLFVDTTGDMMLSELAVAGYMEGREGKNVFGEQYAPDENDSYVMGNTLLFRAVDTGKPVVFEKPFWANTYTEEDLRLRGHGEITSGYWWIELGGDGLDIKHDGEGLRDELLKALYGIWDHIKNQGDHHAENLDLDWVGFLPGKRESRRVIGDYILKEQDVLECRIFDDAVAYGGWEMDMHVVGGLKTTDKEPTNFIPSEDLYTIPYRSLYAKDIENLYIGGRGISASHMAFGSTRVMATCAVIGQAIGTAAAMAIEKETTPRGINQHMTELQNKLMKDDCYLPGFKNRDERDLAREAVVTCSSSLEGYDCDQVINGFSRMIKDESNCWMTKKGDDEDWISLDLVDVKEVKEVQVKFDPDLSTETMPTLSKNHQKRQHPSIPPQLVKAYRLEFWQDEELIHNLDVQNNHLRFRSHQLNEGIQCNQVKLILKDTNGDDNFSVFEIRVY